MKRKVDSFKSRTQSNGREQQNDFKMDRITLKTSTRRYSATLLPKLETIDMGQQLQSLKKQNQELRQENDQLKKQLQTCQTKQVSGSNTQREEKKDGYLQIIKNKLKSKERTSRVTTQCQTGVFSSKEISIVSQVGIQEWYQNYKLSEKLPSMRDLKEYSQKFFSKYCQNYTKLRSIMECVQINRQDNHYQRLKEMIELYKIPLLYQKTPQTLLRALSHSKEKKSSVKKDSVKIQPFCWETLSPRSSLTTLQSQLSKILNSSQMLILCRNSKTVFKFLQKMQQKHY